jgi:predicted RNase H-like nuclease (RuvC/YqgF family)
LTLSECIDKIVREFVPADYFASLNKEQKRNILRSVLIESIREFTKIVIGEFLGAIIDNHDEPANVEALKEKMVDTFIMQRETMFHKFLDCRAGGRPDEKVDKKFVDKLRTEVIRLNQQNQELITANKNLNEQLETVKASAEEVVRRFKLLKNKYDAITQEYRISKEKAKDLEEALNARRATLGTSLSTSIFEDDDVPENMDSKLGDKSEDETPVQVLVSKPISQP